VSGPSIPCPEEQTPKVGSPGVVLNDETIVRFLFDPEDFKDGAIQPGSLGVKRLKKSEFSIARPKHTSLKTVQEQVIDKRTGPGLTLTFVGAIKAQCVAIRSLMATSPSNRIFCVVDDPLPDFVGHGIIGFSEITRQKNYWASKNNDAAAALGNLCLEFEKAGAPLAVEDCFS
jgi:hypothetical protein